MGGAAGSARASELRSALTFGVSAALPIALGVADGGSDLVFRQSFGLVVWWLLALALLFGSLPRAAAPRGLTVCAGGLVALGALQVFGAAWGPSDDRAVADGARTVVVLGVPALAMLALGPGTWRQAAAGLFAGVAAVSALALLGRLVPSLSTMSEVERALGSERLLAPLGYWNALGAWSGAAAAMALALSVGDGGRQRRAVALALVPMLATTAYLTYSRGGLLAGAAAVGTVLVLTRDRRAALRNLLAAALGTAACVLTVRALPEIADGSGAAGAPWVGAVVAVAAALCFAYVAPPRWARRATRGLGRLRVRQVVLGALGALAVAAALAQLGDGASGAAGAAGASHADGDPSARLVSVSGNRSDYWAEALDGFAAHPVRGEGPGSFAYRWAESGRDPELVSDAHSVVLETASELGVLGLIALSGALAGLVAACRSGLVASRRSAPAVAMAAGFAAFGVSIAIDWTWELPAFALLGLGCASALGMAASRRPRARISGRVRGVLVFGAILGGALQVPGIVAVGETREAERVLRAGEAAAAVEAADRAIDAAPWSAAAHAARAEAEVALNKLPAARADALEAVRLEPREADHRILLARIAALEADLREAAAQLRTAIELSPFDRDLLSDEVSRIVAALEAAGLEGAIGR